MPIKPENRARYPVNWNEIRKRILARAGHCCEQCHVPNRARIARGQNDDADTYMMDDAKVYCANTGEYLGQTHMSDYNVGRMTTVVLTIAHLDHTPEHCDDSNLRALCQRCHLAYDRDHHRANAQATRRAKAGTLEMFA